MKTLNFVLFITNGIFSSHGVLEKSFYKYHNICHLRTMATISTIKSDQKFSGRSLNEQQYTNTKYSSICWHKQIIYFNRQLPSFHRYKFHGKKRRLTRNQSSHYENTKVFILIKHGLTNFVGANLFLCIGI